jgi:hypothetical protein
VRAFAAEAQALLDDLQVILPLKPYIDYERLLPGKVGPGHHVRLRAPVKPARCRE